MIESREAWLQRLADEKAAERMAKADKAAAWREQHDAELRQAALERKAEKAEASAAWKSEHDSEEKFAREMAELRGETVEEFKALQKQLAKRMTGGQISYSPDHKILNPTDEQKKGGE